ncbi:leucyl aminopeptidase [Spirochaetota bacterium]
MKFISKKTILKLKNNDTVAIFISDKSLKNILKEIPAELLNILKDIDFSFFKAKNSEIMFIPFSGKPNIILCGVGKSKELDSEALRNAASAVTNVSMERAVKNLHVIVSKFDKLEDEDVIKSIGEGLYLSNYSFSKYKSKDDESKKTMLSSAVFYSNLKGASSILRDVEIISKNTLLCRDLINETSDNCNPESFSREASKMSKLYGTSCKIYNKNEIKKMGMGLLLAVNRGSTIPPRLIVLKYNGNPKSKKYFAVVGKGLTFDSGGMNLKPSGHLETMRMDMSGGAAALYTIKAASDLKLKKNIYSIIPLTENMLSNDAYRPGDVFKSYNGKTVEIGNTDAEGRLILADALSFTESKLKPEVIVDVATLTGSCVAAFGETVAGLLSSDEVLARLIEMSAEKTGEKIWRLPLYDEYKECIKSDIADIVNISSDRNAGAIIGAIFLKNFIKKTKWAHIDIAGTAWYSKKRGYRPKNATGYGVRLLVDVIRNWKG